MWFGYIPYPVAIDIHASIQEIEESHDKKIPAYLISYSGDSRHQSLCKPLSKSAKHAE